MNIVLDTDRVSLIHGESLATLRAFADKSIDIILTDPPYSPHVHAKFGKERRNDGGVVREELDFPPFEQALIREFAFEYVRISRGWILSFTDFYNSALWGNSLEEAGGAWVRTGQWVKTNPRPQMTGDRPACGAEDIVIGHAKTKGFAWNDRGHAAIWRGPGDKGYVIDDAPHPNQKPAWLIQALLGAFAPAGGVVLDPFFGSGTTAVAALASSRIEGEVAAETGCTACLRKLAEKHAPPLPQDLKVIGIEGSAKYAAGAVRRITNVEAA